MELQIPSQINDVPNALIFCLLVIEILCNLLLCSIHGFINIPHCWSWAKLYSVDNLNYLVEFLTLLGYR